MILKVEEVVGHHPLLRTKIMRILSGSGKISLSSMAGIFKTFRDPNTDSTGMASKEAGALNRVGNRTSFKITLSSGVLYDGQLSIERTKNLCLCGSHLSLF